MARLVFDLSWVVFIKLTSSCTFSIRIDKIIVLEYLKLFQIHITDEAHWIPLTNWYLCVKPYHLFDFFGVLDFKSVRVVIIEQSQMHMSLGIWIFGSENVNARTPSVEKWYPIPEANCEILQLLGNGRSWIMCFCKWIGLIVLSKIPDRNLKKEWKKIAWSAYLQLFPKRNLHFENAKYTLGKLISQVRDISSKPFYPWYLQFTFIL